MKKFLASVGRGILLARQSDDLVPVANVNTLTESTLSITSTMEEVRAGQGAKLYGRFNHDAGMTVTLTDAMFDMNYIALQVGSQLQKGGLIMHTETVTCTTAGELTLSQPVKEIGESCGLNKYLVWYRKAGCSADEEYSSVEVAENATTVESDDFVTTAGENTYCVSYFTEDAAASTLLINANFVPAELVLILTTKLFAGDANAPETGKPVGEITIKIPRFQLDGAFDLSMAMSAAATMSLNGTALAVSDGGCDDNGIYAEIVEVIEGAKWYDGLVEFVIDGADEDNSIPASALAVDTVLEVYGVYRNMLPSVIDNSLLTFTAGGTPGTGKIVDGEVTVAFVAGDTITVAIKESGAPAISTVFTVE